jgi:hypothetical protein
VMPVTPALNRASFTVGNRSGRMMQVMSFISVHPWVTRVNAGMGSVWRVERRSRIAPLGRARQSPATGA